MLIYHGSYLKEGLPLRLVSTVGREQEISPSERYNSGTLTKFPAGLSEKSSVSES